MSFLKMAFLALIFLVGCSSGEKNTSENETVMQEWGSVTCPDRLKYFKEHYQFSKLHKKLRSIRKELSKKFYKRAISKMSTFPKSLRLYDFTDDTTLAFLNKNRVGQKIVGKAMSRMGHYESDGPGEQILTPPHYFYDIHSGQKVSLYLFKRSSGKVSLVAAVWPDESNPKMNQDIFNFYLVAGQRSIRATRIDENGEAQVVPLQKFCP